MTTVWAGAVQNVAVDLVNGEQTKFDHEDEVFDADGGTLALHEIPDALAPPDAYIDYTTQARYERDAEEDWQRSAADWQPARCRVYARHVVEVLVTYADR